MCVRVRTCVRVHVHTHTLRCKRKRKRKRKRECGHACMVECMLESTRVYHTLPQSLFSSILFLDGLMFHLQQQVCSEITSKEINDTADGVVTSLEVNLM